jgi:hypothetical protein
VTGLCLLPVANEGLKEAPINPRYILSRKEKNKSMFLNFADRQTIVIFVTAFNPTKRSFDA